ncbi:MAG: trypsin-like serine protease [Oligoflexales bacterium]|nr:trypsin-like serine protease [Oligoflexales bacterium]
MSKFNRYILLSSFLFLNFNCKSVHQNSSTKVTDGARIYWKSEGDSELIKKIKLKILKSLVRLIRPSGSTCTATLVASDRLLTAAHCFPDSGPISAIFNNETQVEGFTNSERPTPQITFSLADAVLNEYDPHKRPDNDIAVVRLPNPENIPNFYEPIKLLGKDVEIQEKSAVIVAGFGRLNSTTTTEHPYFGIMSIEKFQSEDSQIVLHPPEGKNTNLCNGDSGGPTLIYDSNADELYQIGVNVLGSCDKIDEIGDRRPIAYSNDIRKYHDWITVALLTD